MSLPGLSPSRCVLLIGDEELYIYKVSGGRVDLADTVPWQAPDFEESVVRTIRRRCGGRPVMIVNDMTDQHFKGGQRLPKAGPLDRVSIINRRLQVAFPSYPIRGALQIKEKKGERAAAGDEVVSGDAYLFAAMPMSEPVEKTTQAVKASMAAVSGLCLLPVEAADMVKALAAKVAGKQGRPSRWAVFIGQHQGGGLRQVITRDGQLAMTRMTPVIDEDTDPDKWAAEVYQEFKATISYLTRFGYSPSDKMDVMLVANDEGGNSFEKLIDMPCNFTAFTAVETGKHLGIKVSSNVDGRYADSVHAGWIGRKVSLSMPMSAVDLAKFHRPRQVAVAVILLLSLGVAYQGWNLLQQNIKLSQTRGEVKTQKSALASAQAENKEQVDRLSALGIDIKLITAAVMTYDYYNRTRFDPVSFIKKLGVAMGNELHLDNLKINVRGQDVPTLPVVMDDTYKPEPGVLDALLQFSFPPSVAPEEGVKQVNNFEQRLKSALPGYTVTIKKQVADLTYAGTVSGKVGATAEAQVNPSDLIAEIAVTGPAQ